MSQTRLWLFKHDNNAHTWIPKLKITRKHAFLRPRQKHDPDNSTNNDSLEAGKQTKEDIEEEKEKRANMEETSVTRTRQSFEISIKYNTKCRVI